LVVDDEGAILESVKAVLKQEGYEVITALSGAEALDMLKKTKVDLILTDVMMPNMGGLELTRKIREDTELKDVIILVLSIIAFSELQKYKLKKLGILDYIQKPFTNAELVSKVNNIIKKLKG
jgi:DNA-binding response OmpR family regulator